MLKQVQHDVLECALYIPCMSLILGLMIFLGTLFAMELVAYAAHRWLMHGPGWLLHRSHHEPRTGAFEANDWYAAIFAIPSILLIWGATSGASGDWALAVGAGVAAYGAIYFGFHDMIVHGRLGYRSAPSNRYLRRIVQVHRLHHAVETRQGAVSYGFLWAPRPELLKAELERRDRAGVRAPVAAE